MILLVNAEAFHIPLADGVAHLFITSPPYWGLRSYQGTGSWKGGDPECEHIRPMDNVNRSSTLEGGKQTQTEAHRVQAEYREVCALCGARRVDAQLGLERLHDCYGWATGDNCGECFICHLRAWMREVWRVLRDDGQAWINLGDSYQGSANSGAVTDVQDGPKGHRTSGLRSKTGPGLKPKDLCLIPQSAALALRADGWYVRSMIPWTKRNPMPESVTDRPTTAHEYWLQLTKRARYAADGEGWRGKQGEMTRRAASFRDGGVYTNNRSFNNNGSKEKDTHGDGAPSTGRSRRTTDFFFEGLDQEIAETRAYLRHLKEIRKGEGLLLDEEGEPLAAVFNTRGYSGAHFATFPSHMIEAIIKFASPEKCCAKCGKGWERVISERKSPFEDTRVPGNHKPTSITKLSGQKMQKWLDKHPRQTLGFRPSCSCDAGDPVPALVVDIFVGSGTTLLAARALGRNGIGFDLSFDYLREQARKRLEFDALDEWESGKSGETDLEGLPLFDV